MPTQSATGLFDREAALKRLGGSVELLREMFQFFVEDAPALVDTLDRSLASGAADEAYRAAHSLKGLASNFDAHAVTRPAKQMEELIRSGDLTEAKPLATEIRRAVEACLANRDQLLLGSDAKPSLPR
jgi:two-component system, sensor histidine kinase and response regulator